MVTIENIIEVFENNDYKNPIENKNLTNKIHLLIIDYINFYDKPNNIINFYLFEILKSRNNFIYGIQIGYGSDHLDILFRKTIDMYIDDLEEFLNTHRRIKLEKILNKIHEQRT